MDVGRALLMLALWTVISIAAWTAFFNHVIGLNAPVHVPGLGVF